MEQNETIQCGVVLSSSCNLQGYTWKVGGDLEVVSVNNAISDEATDAAYKINKLTITKSKLLVEGDLLLEEGTLEIGTSGKVKTDGNFRIGSKGCVNLNHSEAEFTSHGKCRYFCRNVNC